MKTCHLEEECERGSLQEVLARIAWPTKEAFLRASFVETPLGPMVAVASDEALYLLEFVDRGVLEWELERLGKKTRSAVTPGYTQPIASIENELKSYFQGTLKEFKTPLYLYGSPFQQRVWKELRKIPYGETVSYAALATTIGKPTAYRAVALANASNSFAIVIPCHRVINSSGEIGGYGGGIPRKRWLLNHEAGDR